MFILSILCLIIDQKTKDVDDIPQIRDVVDLRKVTDGPHNTIPV
ncbi:MAG: hypothetical protein K0S91_765 [Nitrososphaeraceae archaeon]|jgi:hypothetical protein|nr:hypothetical protein [Nitrososphaeraceae archaeon]